MNVYVAGKWEDREKVRHWHKVLRDNGHRITCDWTDHEYPEAGQEHLLQRYAVDDIVGVTVCDLLIVIFQERYHYRGALVEMGAALALGKRVWVLGTAEESCIFMEHPSVTVILTEYELLARIEGS
jgi:nucleoside 2-deoxyribosyltransferase